VSFAIGDVRQLVPIDEDGDGRLSSEEISRAGPRLRELAAQALVVECDGRSVEPEPGEVFVDPGDAAHLGVSFATEGAVHANVRCALFTRLPRGHRQNLTLTDESGNLLVNRMLDTKHPSAELALQSLPADERPGGINLLKLGAEHILTGWDHLLFLLALVLVTRSLGEMAKIVTSFTVAHSITLALSGLGVVSLKPELVESVIALSIVYVAVENLVRKDIRRRWLLTFFFGLVHGFGFASALRELGLGADGSGIAFPLLTFNLGIELAQLALAAVALPLIAWLRRRPFFVHRLVPVGSCVVALAGGWWFLERSLGL
jgi:hydrogenase/urease accessory protein HupE